ncbi:uncharacterized protein [Clytia hemisphaerica]|uniref:Ubiquitin-like protease family profile domain-containing protein n=1 Tax=Clytia hemisphaerica TaxID=252671 RepID=A0A7M5UJC7_9CNID
MFGFDEKWSVDVCNHTMQPDLVSCGVFCLWYAELIITAGEVPEILRPPEIRLFRQRIAETLLWIGGNGDWCQKFCRVCGESTPPKKIRPRTKPKWVQCDLCIPPAWYHNVCVGIPNDVTLCDAEFRCDSVNEMVR